MQDKTTIRFNVSGFSTSGLLMMYNGIRQALEADDNTPVGHDKVFGVRDFRDWSEWEKLLSTELDKRKAKYQKVNWLH